MLPYFSLFQAFATLVRILFLHPWWSHTLSVYFLPWHLLLRTFVQINLIKYLLQANANHLIFFKCIRYLASNFSKYGFSICKKNITNAAIPKNLSLLALPTITCMLQILLHYSCPDMLLLPSLLFIIWPFFCKVLFIFIWWFDIIFRHVIAINLLSLPSFVVIFG